jgi:hypothetical protein
MASGKLQKWEVLEMRPKCHYSVTARNHLTGERLKVDLLDIPCTNKTFRIRANGKPAEKVPYGSKTTVLALIRTWLVAH